MTVQKASKGNDAKARDEHGCKRTIDADSDEAATAFFGGGDGNGAGLGVIAL